MTNKEKALDLLRQLTNVASNSNEDPQYNWIQETSETISDFITKAPEWHPIETAPFRKYVILNITPVNYPVIAAKDTEGWMTRTGAFYGVDVVDKWMPLPPEPTGDTK